MFDWLLNFINSIGNVLYDVVRWLLDGGIYVIQYGVYLILQAIFTVILALLNSLDLSFILLDWTGIWNQLPPQMLWFLHTVGFFQGLTMLGGAYGIRMLLNLIPANISRI